MTQERFAVEDRPEESRYVLIDRGEDGSEAGVIGEESYVDVEGDHGTERVFFHTGVSDEYSGQGLASVLVGAAVEQVIAAGSAVVPVCPYVVAWVKKHPEFAEHVVPAGPGHLRAVSERQQR